MNFSRFLHIVRARRRLGLGVLALTLLSALVVSLLLPKTYTADTSIVIDVKSPDPVAGMLLPGLMQPGYMATQVDIIKSERVARQVVQDLGLERNPGVRQQWQEETGGKGSLSAWLGALLQKRLNVHPSRESNVVEISFSATDPQFAAAVANAFAQAYIATNVGLRSEPAQQYAKWFETQTAHQRKRLEQAQKALSGFQQQTGIVATDERLDFEIARLNELSAQLTQAQLMGQDASSKQKSSNETLPEVMQNPLIAQLKADIARLEGQVREQVARSGANYPQVQNLNAQLAGLKQNLRAETARIGSALGTSGQISRNKIGSLEAAIAAQKQKVLEINRQRDRMNVLQLEVQSAQRVMDTMNQRAAQSKLEADAAQTNISVLSVAQAPLLPSNPKVLLNLFAALVIGLALAAAAMLLREWLDRRVRSVEELATITGMPVLGVVGDVHALPRTRRIQALPNQSGQP